MGMEFCSRCGKVLLPKDGKIHCYKCGYEKLISDEDKKQYVVSEDVSNKNEVIVANDKIITHPTTRGLCYRCGNRELEWWLIQMRKSDEGETRFYRCTKCGNTWRRSG